jgi:hypothetical protein
MESAGRPFRLFWMLDETHASFFRRRPSLFVIALQTARDDVVPGLASPSDNRNYMIESQILGGTFLATVLAGVMITGVDVRSVEFDVLKVLMDFYVFEQSQDTGHFDCEADAVDFPIIFRQHLHFALEEKGYRAFPAYNIDGLICCVQDECVFHLLFPAINSKKHVKGAVP